MESTQNSILSGSDSKLFVNRVIDLVDNQAPKGGSVTLTVDPDAQKAAYDGLKALGENVRGAVVAIEPSTGKILAMVSSPSYDPNRLASHDFTAVGKTKQRAREGPARPAEQPGDRGGAAAGLDVQAGHRRRPRSTPASTPPRPWCPAAPPSTCRRPARTSSTRTAAPAAPSKITLTRALEVSCNVSFGAVGLKIGDDKIRDTAEKFGFGKRYFHDLDDALTRQALSRFPEDPDKPQTALSAIGQFDVAATPLQMAMVGAGIANDGVVMKPYLVDEIKSPKLDVLGKTEPEPMPDQPAISSASARDLTQMMVSVVENGTGGTAQDPGRRGRRQDRHRPERAGPAAVRLVRVVRPGRAPRPSRSPCSSRTRAWPVTRSPAAAWPRRSPSRSWRR